MNVIKQVSLVFASFLLAAVATAAIASEPIGKRIVLDNGMILLFEEKKDIPMVTVSVAVNAGGIVEPADKPGVASLTASLLMQGTKTRTAGEISREIDFVGGSLSVSGGGDYATAGLRVLTKDLRKGFDLLADVLMNPVFDQKEIDRKVKETLAEIQRQKEEPESIASQAFAKAVFGDHPYGKTNEDVAAYLPKLSRADILDFYAAHYGPNAVIIAVVGDVEEQNAVSLILDSFKKWKRTGRSVPSHREPPKREATTVIKIDKKVTQASIAIGHVGIDRANPDFYAVMVMNYILGGGGFSSRLMDNIRDNRGLAYDVHSSFSAQKEPGAFQVWIQTKNESANDALDEVFKELRRLQAEPVAAGELADAKAYLTGSFPLRMDTSAKIAGMLTSIEIYNLGLDYPRRYPDLIKAVTADDVLRVAKKYLRPDATAIVVVANQEKAKLKY